MMHRQILSLRVLVAVFLLAGIGQTDLAYGDKIAYVDARTLVEKSPQGRDEVQRLEDEFAERSRELRGRIEQFRQEEADLEKNALTMSQDDVEAKSRELREMQRSLKREQQAYNEDYAQRRNQGLAELERVISEVVIFIAKEGDYDLVVQQAVYASPRIDITDKVLAELEKRHNQ